MHVPLYVGVMKTSTGFGFVKNEGGMYGYEGGMLRDLKSLGRVVVEMCG